MPAAFTMLEFRRIQVLAWLWRSRRGVCAQEPWPRRARGELGVRYWLSTGETKTAITRRASTRRSAIRPRC